MPHNKLINIKVLLIFFIFIAVLLIITKTVSGDIPIETGILGTMYTFFYGLFINSIFKFLDEKYTNVRELLGDLIGKSQSLYNIALLTDNKKFIGQIKNDLLGFLKTFNDLKPEKYYENQYYIDKFYHDLRIFNVKTAKNAQEYSRMIQLIDYLSITREKLEIFGKKHIKGETKFILVSTSLLYFLLIAVITFSSINIYINIVGVLLILMVAFVILLMFNLDNLSYGTYYIKSINIEEIIQDIKGNHL